MTTVLVDCDNVLCDFTAAYLDAMFVVTGRMREHHHVTSFDFTKCITTVEEDRAIWRHLSDSDAVLKTLKWEEGAREALKELRINRRVVCVTAPASIPNWVPCRNEWLKNAGFEPRDIIYAKDKSMVRGDFFIEDHAANFAGWQSSWGGGAPAATRLLINKPWNQSAVPYPQTFTRINSLQDAVEIIHQAEYGDD